MLSEIVSDLLQWVFSLVQTYGAYSVFFAVLLEELLLPIPSPLFIMGASIILIPPDITFWDAASRIFFTIVIPASLASTIGSFFAYGIGYFGGRPLITRFRKSLMVSWLDVERFEKQLEKGKKVWVTIAVLRAIPFFPIAFVSLSAGILRLSWKKYTIATFIGSVPRTFVLGIAGWQIGSAYVSLAKKLNDMENIIAVLVAISIIYILYQYRHTYAHHYKRVIEKTRRLRKNTRSYARRRIG